MSGWLLIGFAVGIVANIVVEFATKPKCKKHLKLKKIQPTIEVFGKNYKKVSFKHLIRRCDGES